MGLDRDSLTDGENMQPYVFRAARAARCTRRAAGAPARAAAAAACRRPRPQRPPSRPPASPCSGWRRRLRPPRASLLRRRRRDAAGSSVLLPLAGACCSSIMSTMVVLRHVLPPVPAEPVVDRASVTCTYYSCSFLYTPSRHVCTHAAALLWRLPCLPATFSQPKKKNVTHLSPTHTAGFCPTFLAKF